MNRDIYQKIAEKSDDKTVLLILSSIKEVNKDIYYSIIFGKRYPDLIKYREEDESIKKLYLRMLEIIGKLKEQFEYTYISGNPEYQLKVFKESKGNINDLLISASGNGELEIVKYALEKGADIHADDDAALRRASYYGNLEVVKYLVEQGADVNADSDYALISASQKGHLEIVKYLIELEKGANIRADVDFALRKASSNGHLEVVKYLVERGANIHAVNDYASRWASYYGHLEVVKYLKEKMEQ